MCPKQGRQFLHDLANPLTVALLLSKKLDQLNEQGILQLGKDDIKKLKRILTSLEKMELIHADFKFVLAQEELAEKQKSRVA